MMMRMQTTSTRASTGRVAAAKPARVSTVVRASAEKVDRRSIIGTVAGGLALLGAAPVFAFNQNQVENQANKVQEGGKDLIESGKDALNSAKDAIKGAGKDAQGALADKSRETQAATNKVSDNIRSGNAGLFGNNAGDKVKEAGNKAQGAANDLGNKASNAAQDAKNKLSGAANDAANQTKSAANDAGNRGKNLFSGN